MIMATINPQKMKIRFLFLLLFAAFSILSSAQDSTAARLQTAQNLWVTYNAGSWQDTSSFAQMQSLYTGILVNDTTNQQANNGLGDLYQAQAAYWMNTAGPLETSYPTSYNIYMARSDSYHALAAPYLQRYLRLTGVTH